MPSIEAMLPPLAIGEGLSSLLNNGEASLDGSPPLFSHATFCAIAYTSHQIDQGSAIPADHAVVRVVS